MAPSVRRLVRGQRTPLVALEHDLGAVHVAALLAAGAADTADGAVVARFTLVHAPPAVVVVPRPVAGSDDVYIGSDSRLLLRVAWRLAPGGRAAVDLGTGTGYLAAALASRYDFTVATDLSPSTAAVAAVNLALRPGSGRTGVCVADGAAGLRSEAFDLVVANPPWVPAGSTLSSDGGPTGFELPRRFLVEGASLLAPGGIALFQCLDATGPGRGRPLHDVCATLDGAGLAVEVRPATPQWPALTEWTGEADAGFSRLVTVVMRRPVRARS